VSRSSIVEPEKYPWRLFRLESSGDTPPPRCWNPHISIVYLFKSALEIFIVFAHTTCQIIVIGIVTALNLEHFDASHFRAYQVGGHWAIQEGAPCDLEHVLSPLVVRRCLSKDVWMRNLGIPFSLLMRVLSNAGGDYWRRRTVFFGSRYRRVRPCYDWGPNQAIDISLSLVGNSLGGLLYARHALRRYLSSFFSKWQPNLFMTAILHLRASKSIPTSRFIPDCECDATDGSRFVSILQMPPWTGKE
jgi:hypothetical protein